MKESHDFGPQLQAIHLRWEHRLQSGCQDDSAEFVIEYAIGPFEPNIVVSEKTAYANRNNRGERHDVRVVRHAFESLVDELGTARVKLVEAMDIAEYSSQRGVFFDYCRLEAEGGKVKCGFDAGDTAADDEDVLIERNLDLFDWGEKGRSNERSCQYLRGLGRRSCGVIAKRPGTVFADIGKAHQVPVETFLAECVEKRFFEVLGGAGCDKRSFRAFGPGFLRKRLRIAGGANLSVLGDVLDSLESFCLLLQFLEINDLRKRLPAVAEEDSNCTLMIHPCPPCLRGKIRVRGSVRYDCFI